MVDLDDMNKGQVKRLYAFLQGKATKHVRDITNIAEEVKDEKVGDTAIFNQDDVNLILDEF